GRLFLLVIAACAALSAGAIARQVGGPAALYGGKAARVLGLAGLSGALLLLLSALFMPSWWSGRRPIRWIALPYGLTLLALALDLAAGAGLLIRIDTGAQGQLGGGAALAAAFALGWLVHLGLLLAAYASSPHQRPLISLLFGSLLLAMLVGAVNLRIEWLRDVAGLLETTLLLSILAYIVLNRRLFEPTRVALELALRAMSEIVAVLDPEGKILFANPRAKELGLRVDQPLTASQLAAGAPERALGGSDELARVIAQGGVVSEPTVLDAVPIGDPPRLLELKLAPIRDRDGRLGGILLLGHDITEIERRNVLLAEEQRRLADAVHRLGYLATHDPMTDLPNRRSLELELAQALERAGSVQAVLLFIDLDDFKLVNDSLGHAAGDEVLVAVTKRLAAQLRAGDLLARLGGDEFAVLLRDGGLEAALAVARRMLDAVRGQDFALYGQRFRLGLSVGLAAVDGQFSAGELVEQADLAMYMAKERGGHQLMTYQPSMAAVPPAPRLSGGQRLADRLQQA
ncbi:MAG TPA: diguanylate cyclase, partial [Herpetosiphonaceae bacterium]